ncbi:TraB/GumN family protein [Marinilongibacter aquaticus]|uniref:TraB/GumN family protein n=1 Tax=Marinilongibacter aquaticus TaxID=2975157 RepID=UPI0021BDB529|nr:TraB/GumN family protein [Marinilongibacter aquaticus]UBM59838.1 TraB/GumN family protein [Marinilongibacter aquaticus]
MRAQSALFLSCFLLFSPLSSARNPVDSAVYKTILFEITSPQSLHRSYLFGTHHAFGKPFFDSLTKANQALQNSDVLIKENRNVPGHLAEDIINRRNAKTKWSKFLNKTDLAFINDLFSSSPTDFQKMTPAEMQAFLNRYFKSQVCLSKNPSDTSLSLDDYIGLNAEQQNMKLIGLETTEEQIALLNKDVAGMPVKVHKRRLSAVINHIRTQNTNNCGETDWYARMQIDYHFEEACKNTLILSDRNNKWMSTIEKQIEANNCFIVVGLSHLMYSCGLVNQLREKGYSLKAIPVK